MAGLRLKSDFCRLRRPHLVQQVRVPVQHLEQFHERQRRLGLAIFVAREGIHAAAEDFRRLALVEMEFLAHAGGDKRTQDADIARAIEIAKAWKE